MKNNIWIEASYILKNKTGIGAYTIKLMEILDTLGAKYNKKELAVNLPYKYIWQTIWLNTLIFILLYIG